MTITRRNLVAGLAAAGALSGAVAPALARAASGSRFKAVVFDGFPIIDPRPVASLAEQLFPGKGAELSNSWRTRQFEYCWLRTLSDRYADFRQVTQEALVFAAKSLRLDLSASARDRLVHAYLTLSAWPDVLPALRSLKAAGIRMAFLSNLTAEMLDAAVRNSALNDFFEAPLTTDRVRAFKPDPRAYRNGADGVRLPARGDRLRRLGRLGCRRREVVRLSDLLGKPHGTPRGRTRCQSPTRKDAAWPTSCRSCSAQRLSCNESTRSAD